MGKYNSDGIVYLLEDFIDFLDKQYNHNKMKHSDYEEAINLIEQFKHDYKQEDYDDEQSNAGIDYEKNHECA